MNVERIKAALDAHDWMDDWEEITSEDVTPWVVDRFATRVAEVIAALLPEASESVEWGVRYARDPSATYPISEQGARELADESDDVTAVRRTAWRTDWAEVTP